MEVDGVDEVLFVPVSPVPPGFPREGSYAVPGRPGLGFTLNHDAVKRYLVREQSFS